MNCCDANGQCIQGFNCPGREMRGQALAADRKWGEMPIQFVGEEPDESPHTAVLADMLKGAAMALAAVVFGVFVGVAIYLK